ncbi:MAG: MFS transporter [Pseudomonadota bacterium]
MSAAEAVPLKTKLAFGVGAAGESVATFGFATFVFFYYNQVLGLPGTLAGLATTVSLVVDAVTDPLMGSISDRWRSRWGRRHPFMFFAAIPLGVTFFCIFSPPSGLGEWALFCWLTGFSVLMRMFVTMFNIPHLALGAELSEDYLQRSVVMSYNTIFGWVGGAGIFLLAQLVYFRENDQFENGLLNQMAYPAFGLTASLLIVAGLLFCCWFTRDRIPLLPKVSVSTLGMDPRAMFGELLEVLRTRNYLMLLLGLLFLAITLGTRATIEIHMNTYFWELVPSQLAWFPLGSGIGFILAFLMIKPLHQALDKRGAAVFGVVLLVFFATAPVVGRFLGLMPGNEHNLLLPLLVFFSGAGYWAFAILNISVLSMLADIADQHELTTGNRREGMFYSARTFFSKATTALGALVGGIAIDVINFPSGAKPGEVPQETLIQLGLLDGPISVIPALIAIYFYSKYSITRDEHAQTRRALNELQQTG